MQTLIDQAAPEIQLDEWKSQRRTLLSLSRLKTNAAQGDALLSDDPTKSIELLKTPLENARTTSENTLADVTLASWLVQRGQASLDQIGSIPFAWVSEADRAWIERDIRAWHEKNWVPDLVFDELSDAAPHEVDRNQVRYDISGQMIARLFDSLSLATRFPLLQGYASQMPLQRESPHSKEKLAAFEKILSDMRQNTLNVIDDLYLKLPQARELSKTNMAAVARAADKGPSTQGGMDPRFDGSIAGLAKSRHDKDRRELDKWFSGKIVLAMESAGQKNAHMLGNGFPMSHGPDIGRWYANDEIDNFLDNISESNSNASGCVSAAQHTQALALRSEMMAVINYSSALLTQPNPKTTMAGNLTSVALLRAWLAPEVSRDAKLFGLIGESGAALTDTSPKPYVAREILASLCPLLLPVAPSTQPMFAITGPALFRINAKPQYVTDAMDSIANILALDKSKELLSGPIPGILAREQAALDRASERRYSLGSDH